MAKSAAVKRLERILADEDYGPKLARMNRKNEAYILDLIDRNKGREARKEILRLDEQRRAARRTRRPRTKPTTISIEQLRRDATRKLHSQWERRTKYNAANTRRRVNQMTRDDLTFTISATTSELETRANEPATPYPDLDIELNVFWYH